MELDLTPFLPLLKQLGPWGWVAAGVIWFIQFRRQKSPSPVPTDPNAPAPVDPFDDLLDRVRDRLKNRFPNLPLGDVAEGSHPTVLMAQRDELERQIERRREELAAQIQALGGKR